MKKIWIFNHYAAMNTGRLPEIAQYLSKKGYDVTLFISSFSNAKKIYIYDDEIKFLSSNNVKYVCVHTSPAYKGNGVKRIMNMIDYCVKIWNNKNQIEKYAGIPSLIIGSSVHPFVWELACRFSKKYHIKFIAELRDLWPLSMIEIQHLKKYHPLCLLFGWIEQRAYRRSCAIVTSMPFAYKYICEKYSIPREKVVWLPNGIDTALADASLATDVALPDELNSFLEKNWCCIYTGSLVDSECVEYMVRSFNKLRDTNVYFAIVGSGSYKTKIINLIEQLELKNVKVFEPISKAQVYVALNKAKCCIAAIHNYPIYQYGLSMNKLSDYLYSGKPVIFACNHDNVVKDAGQTVIQCEDEEALARTIIDIKDHYSDYLLSTERSRQHILDYYDYSKIADKYAKLIEEYSSK